MLMTYGEANRHVARKVPLFGFETLQGEPKRARQVTEATISLLKLVVLQRDDERLAGGR
jgi:hypothetical protein